MKLRSFEDGSTASVDTCGKLPRSLSSGCLNPKGLSYPKRYSHWNTMVVVLLASVLTSSWDCSRWHSWLNSWLSPSYNRSVVLKYGTRFYTNSSGYEKYELDLYFTNPSSNATAHVYLPFSIIRVEASKPFTHFDHLKKYSMLLDLSMFKTNSIHVFMDAV